MLCQILFLGKNKENITNLMSTDLAKRVVKVNVSCFNELTNCVDFTVR